MIVSSFLQRKTILTCGDIVTKMENWTAILKTLADENRLQIIHELLNHETTVQDLSAILMEKRCSKRKPVNLEAELISDGINYSGFIENIYKHGLHIIAASKKSITSFFPETIINIKIRPRIGKKINLYCEVRWVHINKTPIHGFTYRMGVEILKQPPEYKKFLNTLK